MFEKKKSLRRKRDVDSDNEAESGDGAAGAAGGGVSHAGGDGVDGAAVSGAVAEGDGAQPVVSADAMHKRLFGEDDLSDGEPTPAVVAGRDEEFDFEHGSDSENEFVQGGPQRKRKRPARRIGGAAVHTDVQEERLTEAAEIFGDENNFLELMAVGRAARERGAVDEDIFGDAASTALSAEERAAMKRLKEERERQELLRKFEPAVLAEKHLTPTDELLKRSEAPERYARDFELQSNEHVAASLRQLYAPDDAAYAAAPADGSGALFVRRPLPKDDELNAEAQWIVRHRLRGELESDAQYAEAQVMVRVKTVLEQIRCELAEVPYIAQYKKELYSGLNAHHLRLIADADRDWHQLQLHRARVRQLMLVAMQRLEMASSAIHGDTEGGVDESARAAEADAAAVVRLLHTEFALALATTEDELDDIARFCLLHQARHETLYEHPPLQQDLRVVQALIADVVADMNDVQDKANALLQDYKPDDEIRFIKDQAASQLRTLSARLDELQGRQVALREHLRRPCSSLPGMQLEQYRRALRFNYSAWAPLFGISAQQLGENVKKNYQEHAPIDPTQTPIELALDVASQSADVLGDGGMPVDRDPDDVLAGIRALLVEEILADPAIRRAVRDRYVASVVLHTEPTDKGDLDIDAFHQYAPIKMLSNKPVRALLGTPQFLAVLKAARDGLIRYELRLVGDVIAQDVESVYLSDRVSDHARLWNQQRALVIREALRNRLYEQLHKETVALLTDDAQRAVQRAVRLQARRLFEAGPYRRANEGPKRGALDDDDDNVDDFERTVMSFVWGGENVPTMCAVLDRDGELKETLQLHHLYRIRTVQAGGIGSTERRTAPSDMVRDELKQADCARIAELVLAYRPVVIGVGIAALQLEARDLLSDLFDIVSELYRAEKIDRPIDVHAVDGMPARLWAASALARGAFPDHHEMMRQSIAVGRRLLDPLCEFAALFADTERPLQYLQWHPLQSELPRDVLLATLESELVDAVCKVGVDVHRAIVHPHARPLLSFVAGIGERKSAALVRAAQRLGGRIVSRVAATGKRGKVRGSHRGRRGRDKADDASGSGDGSNDGGSDDDGDGGRADLESLCRLIGGATVWRNCVAFLRISKRYISSDALDVRDSTRVHPDDYPMLVKMALDMFGGDADGGGGQKQLRQDQQISLCRKLLDEPARFDEFDLGAYAQYLLQRGADKRLTMADMAAEVRAPFADPRRQYEPPSPEEQFYLLTGETTFSLTRGVLLTATATLVGRSRVRCRLDCGVEGVVLAQDLSDDLYVESCETRVQRNQLLHARVLAIDFPKLEVSLTTKSSLLGVDSQLVAERVRDLEHQERFLDAREAFGKLPLQARAERRERAAAAAAVAAAGGDQDALPVELNRLIVHPLFRNVSFQRAERELGGKPVGSVMFRPSSKGTDFLTLTWFFSAGPPAIFVHISILESEKSENAAALGKKLTIDGAPFADINEISARYVEPMNDLVRRMVAFDKFSTLAARDAAKKLESDKNANPESIPYLLRVSDEHPGRFELMYQAARGGKPRREIVTLSPDGYRLRHKVFGAPRELINWFKLNWHKPIKRRPAPPIEQQPTSSVAASSTSTAASAVAALSSTLAQLSATGPLGRAAAASGVSMPPRRAPLPTPAVAAPQRGAVPGAPPSWANVRAVWMDQPPAAHMMPQAPLGGGGVMGGWASGGGWGMPMAQAPPPPFMMGVPPPTSGTVPSFAMFQPMPQRRFP